MKYELPDAIRCLQEARRLIEPYDPAATVNSFVMRLERFQSPSIIHGLLCDQITLTDPRTRTTERWSLWCGYNCELCKETILVPKTVVDLTTLIHAMQHECNEVP